jgi:DNA-binding GntR family transcriptional regulator
MSQLLDHTLHKLCGILAMEWENGVRNCRTETEYCKELQVSRSTLRKAFEELEKQGVVQFQHRKKVLIQKPPTNTLESGPPETKYQSFENYFLSLVSSGKLLTGGRLSESELSKASGCTVGTVREVLNKLSAYGILSKEPRKNWEVISFDQKNIEHIIEVRLLFEQHAIDFIQKNPTQHLKKFEQLLIDHKQLAAQKQEDLLTFRKLDKAFHKALFSVSGNPLIADQFLLVSLMIHSNIDDSPLGREYSIVGLNQHITMMEAMFSGDWELAKGTHKMHLLYSSYHNK